jgi:hypothetical protein
MLRLFAEAAPSIATTTVVTRQTGILGQAGRGAYWSCLGSLARDTCHHGTEPEQDSLNTRTGSPSTDLLSTQRSGAETLRPGSCYSMSSLLPSYFYHAALLSDSGCCLHAQFMKYEPDTVMLTPMRLQAFVMIPA